MKKLQLRLLLTFVVLVAPLSCFISWSQPKGFKTSNEVKTIEISPADSYSNICKGFFFIYNEQTHLARIYSVSGEQTGKVTHFGNVPEFNEHGYSIVHLKNDYSSGYAIINTKGEIIKSFGPYNYDRRPSLRGDYGIMSYTEGRSTKIQYFTERGDYILIKNRADKTSILSSLIDGRRLVKVDLRSEGRGYVYGYLDEKGNTIINPEYLDAHPFSEGYAAVKYLDPERGIRWKFVDTKGDDAPLPTFGTEPGDFHDGFATVVKTDGSRVYLAIDGSVSPSFSDRTRFCGGHACVLENGGLFFINKNFTRFEIPSGIGWPLLYSEKGKWAIRQGWGEDLVYSMTPYPKLAFTYSGYHSLGASGQVVDGHHLILRVLSHAGEAHVVDITTGEITAILKSSEF